MTNYLSFWNIEKPVFVNRNDSPILLANQQKTVAKLIVSLNSGLKSIAIIGDQGTGKSLVTNHVYKNLPISNFSCLKFQPTETNSTSNELLRKIILHLKTNQNIPVSDSELSQIVTKELKRIDKIEQTIVVFIDLDIFEGTIPTSLIEAVSLADLAEKMDLPVQFVFTLSSKLKLEENSIYDRLGSIIRLPNPSLEDIIQYTGDRLKSCGLNEDLFSQKNIELIYKKANHSLNRYSRLCEEILIEASFNQEKLISSQRVFETLTGNTQAINTKSEQAEGTEAQIEVTESTSESVPASEDLIGLEGIQSMSVPETTEKTSSTTETVQSGEEETLPLSILDPTADQHEIVHDPEISYEPESFHGPIELEKHQPEKSIKISHTDETLHEKENIEAGETEGPQRTIGADIEHEIQISKEETNTQQLRIGSPNLLDDPAKKEELEPQATKKHKEQKGKKPQKNKLKMLKEENEKKRTVHHTPFEDLLKNA